MEPRTDSCGPDFSVYRLHGVAVADVLARVVESERHWLQETLLIVGHLEGGPVALAICTDRSGILFNGDPEHEPLAPEDWE